MEPLAVFRRAKGSFRIVLENIGSDELESPTPCSEWTVRDVIMHVIVGDYRFSGIQVPPIPRDLRGLIDAHSEAAGFAEAVFSAPGGLERDYSFASNVVSGQIAILKRSRDSFVHGWDLAKATGQPSDLDPEVAEYLLSFSRQEFNEPQGASRRGPGLRYAEERPCRPGSLKADQLAAFLGRTID